MIQTAQWIAYTEMNVIQKINVKSNSAAAMVKYNNVPNTPAMYFALADFKHSPDVYSSPFLYTRYN